MTFLVLALMNYCLFLIPPSKFSSCKNNVNAWQMVLESIKEAEEFTIPLDCY